MIATTATITATRVHLAARALREIPAAQRDARLAAAVEAYEAIVRRERPFLDPAEVATEVAAFAEAVIAAMGDPVTA